MQIPQHVTLLVRGKRWPRTAGTTSGACRRRHKKMSFFLTAKNGPRLYASCTSPLHCRLCARLLGWRTDSFRSGTPSHRCSEGTTIKADVGCEHKLCDAPQYFSFPTRPTLIITFSPTELLFFCPLCASTRRVPSRNFILDSMSASIRIAEAQQVKVSADIFAGPLAVDIISSSRSSAQLPFSVFPRSILCILFWQGVRPQSGHA